MALDILFCRPCKRCHEAFLYCRSREPGRRYCGDCATPAQKDRERKARKAYRESPEGIEQHRDEEAERRERERVGDRRLEVTEGQLQVASAVAPYTRTGEENRDEPGRGRGEQVEWLVVAWPGLLEGASGLLGTEVECPGCSRRGFVVRVLSLDDWCPEDGS